MLIQADARALPLVDGCVDCCVTSPPYFGLRDYGHAGQIGLEASPDAYVAALVGVFREVRRVLKDSGVCWLNLGDSYAGSWGNQGRKPERGTQRPINGGMLTPVLDGRYPSLGSNTGAVPVGLKGKDLMGIPWRVAFALQADGWVLRQEVIWEKRNPMPESVRDRCTKSHEQLFMFAKAKWNGPAKRRFADITDYDAKWLATLVDAEGCIVVKRVKQTDGGCDVYAAQVSIGGTSKPFMDQVAATVGHGSVLERTGTNAPMYYWQVAHSYAADFLCRIYPFLIIKQRQARIAIHVHSLTYWRGGQKPERKRRTQVEDTELRSLWARNKECNHFGHPDLSDVPEPKYGRWSDCADYHYDAAAIAEPYAASTLREFAEGYEGLAIKDYADAGVQNPSDVKSRIIAGARTRAMRVGKVNNHDRKDGYRYDEPMDFAAGRNRRTVWTIPTMPYAGAHFATMPEKLVEPCILAGCPMGGLVLDPFSGSGTVLAVAERLGRRGVGVDLNPAYHQLAKVRTAQRGLRFAEDAI